MVVVKWELDFWYELWDRAGSKGLDTWYDPRGAGGEGDLSSPSDTVDAVDTANPKGHEDAIS